MEMGGKGRGGSRGPAEEAAAEEGRTPAECRSPGQKASQDNRVIKSGSDQAGQGQRMRSASP